MFMTYLGTDGELGYVFDENDLTLRAFRYTQAA